MVAASILPITIHNNKLHFLFGKENPMEDSAKGWSDFGGRVDDGETIIQAALREGSEELTGFLGDERQQDSKGGNGLTFLMEHFAHIEEIGCVQFDKSDVVRNPLIAKIERVFDSLQNK